MKQFILCAECGMPVLPKEYHPYAACVLYRQLGQSDKVSDLLLDVVRYGYKSAQKGVSLIDAMRDIAVSNIASPAKVAKPRKTAAPAPTARSGGE
jgi:hypothetical protein